MKVERLNEIKYLAVDAGVRYYEDAVVNGKDDVSVYDNPDIKPNMPCVEQIKEEPTGVINSDHLRWRPVIDIKTGVIINWDKGNTAHAFYKVCDDGVYSLLDENKNTIYEVESYVPDVLSIEDKGYGDYIDMIINENGEIHNWSCTEEDIKDILRGDFGYDYDDDDD